MLKAEDAILVVIDIQGKLAQVVHESQRTIENACKLIRGAKVLELPILWTQQYPEGMGRTVEAVASLLEGEAINKTAFSCCGEKLFIEALEKARRREVVLVGIETHVCVYQTAVDLLDRGMKVHVAVDAVSSRTAANRDIGLQKMRDAGAMITSVETVLFEMLQAGRGEKFKKILRIVK